MTNRGLTGAIGNNGLKIKKDAQSITVHFARENVLIRHLKDGTLTEVYCFDDGNVWVFEDDEWEMYDMDDYCMVEVCNLDNGGTTEIRKLSEDGKLREKYIRMLIDGE